METNPQCMPRRSEYPTDIDLKIPDEVSDKGFNTDSQQEAAHILADHWNGSFTELSKKFPHDEGNPSRALFQKVYDRYFGPEGSEETFREIYSEYDSLEDWREASRLQKAAAQAGLGPLDDEALEVFKQGVRFGLELGVQQEEIRREINNKP